MPLNLAVGPRNRLTKQQKAECTAAVYGLKATITDEDINFTQRLLAQQENNDTIDGNYPTRRRAVASDFGCF